MLERKEAKDCLKRWHYPNPRMLPKKISKKIIRELMRKPPLKRAGELFPPLVRATTNETFCYLEGLLSRCQTEIQRTEKSKSWPIGAILALVLHDIHQNNRSLERVGDGLLAHGIPVRAWLVEYEDRLYNEAGEETYEPIFSPGYLPEVLGAMHKLSTGVFGTTSFTYEQLASALRESRIDYIRKAVHRIGIVTSGKIHSGMIWHSDLNWRWDNPPSKASVSNALRGKLKKLEKLGKPNLPSHEDSDDES
ncbi:MAG: hypothetical protein WBM17_12135 [Anaerolineales bacterium]